MSKLKDELDPPFEVLEPAKWCGPVIFNSPHSGNIYPRAFLTASRLDLVTLRRSEDSFVDELANVSGTTILPFFRSALSAEDKSGGGSFDPVTEADRGAEAVIRQKIRAMFPNPDDILTSGQTVRVIVEEKGGDQVVVIPQSAIAIDQTGSYVFVVGQDNKVEQRRVRLGAQREGLAVVEQGVEAGERVVVQGQQRIRAGMTVAPQVAPSPSG